MTEQTPKQNEETKKEVDLVPEKGEAPKKESPEFIHNGAIGFTIRCQDGRIEALAQPTDDKMKAICFGETLRHIVLLIETGKNAPKDNRPFAPTEFQRLKEAEMIVRKIMNAFLNNSYHQIAKEQSKPTLTAVK